MVSSRLELHTVLFSSLSSTLPGFQALTCFRLSKTLNRNRNSTPLSAASSAANSPQHLSSSSPPASPSSSEGWPPPETHKRKRQRLDYSSSDSEIAHVMQITSKESTPGSSQQQNNGKSRQENGNGSLSEKADMLGRVKKSELVRLILQSLHDLGYHDAAAVLQRDSNVSLEEASVTRFRQSILNGEWRLAETLLPSLTSDNPNDLAQAKFLIRQQEFLELLESQKTMAALQVLRNDLTPLGQNVERLHQLSSLIFCSSVDDIKAQAQWDGSDGSSRQQLMIDLQRYISPSTMIPNGRLLQLIEQAFEWQRKSCLYHNSSNAEYSLFADHVCDKTQFPSTTIKILEGHDDEVWHMAFSNSGQYLASLSRDKTCIIWDMMTFQKVQVIPGHSESASYCAWSPDDRKLLICGTDSRLRLWDPHNAELLHTYSEHKDQVTCCAWLPDSEHFISGATDRSMILWHIDGRILNRWTTKRILDMKITADGRRLATTSYEKTIDIYDVDRFKLIEVGKIQEAEAITSLTLSSDGRYALVNIQASQRNSHNNMPQGTSQNNAHSFQLSEELHLWDLELQSLSKKYAGQKQDSYVIRSTFGGDEESFIISGSEDHCVYVWSREHQSLLEVLSGHRNVVNCVAWSPTDSMMFASASDDKTVRIWGLPRQDDEPMEESIHV